MISAPVMTVQVITAPTHNCATREKSGRTVVQMETRSSSKEQSIAESFADEADSLAKKWVQDVIKGDIAFGSLSREIFYSQHAHGYMAAIKAMLELVVRCDFANDDNTLNTYKKELVLGCGLRDMVHLLRDDSFECVRRDPRHHVITLIQVLSSNDKRFVRYVHIVGGLVAIRKIAETKGLHYDLMCTSWNAMAQLLNTGLHA